MSSLTQVGFSATNFPKDDFMMSDDDSTGEITDRTLVEIRATRRLENVASSIERFLLGQFTRLEEALSECQAAEGHDQIVQRMITDFDAQKCVWEAQRQEEIEQLRVAYEKLMDGWKQLEDEKREWEAQRT